MKLIYKLLIGYFLIVGVIGAFCTGVLFYTVEKNSENLSIYREREITSFVKVLNAAIIDKGKLRDLLHIEHIFNSTISKLPHIKRLTLHQQNSDTLRYSHVISTVPKILGSPSHQEDIDAILHNRTTLLYETSEEGEHLIDITYPVTDCNGKAIAAIGVAVSLKESDKILKKAINSIKVDATKAIFVTITIAIILSLIFTLIITKKIISPIQKLKKAINLSSKKELNENIEVDSNDEIGELSIAFNEMAHELNMLHSSMEEQIDLKSIELEKQFLIDSLTNLPNREALFKNMKNIPKFHIAILDISSFKNINDVYGVELGNKVIQKFSQKVRLQLRGTELKLYRLSADEVVILNPSIQTEDKFSQTIKEIIKDIEHNTFYFDDKDLEIDISLHAGISFEKEHAIEKANVAIKKAKKGHLDSVVYDETYQENRHLTSIEMIKKIKHAISNYGFIAYYQPIVDREKNIIKYESLVRMRDNQKILSPFYFLDIAKKTKYYQHITRAVIYQAFKEFQDRNELISVNLSADDIINSDTQ
ncbi:MAG: diguanylate cyclase, partial [Sulfurimonas sp.]|nr:diguanylate cyclase [Sulfurimonas sp.]